MRRQREAGTWSLRSLIGAFIFVSGVSILLANLAQYVASRPVVENAFFGGSIAALATALGTLPALFSRRLSNRTQDTLFGFGAGVMLAACAFSLVIPGLAAAQVQGYGKLGSGLVVVTSLVLGALTLLLLENVLPDEHSLSGFAGEAGAKLRRTWIFVFAIVLHNIPEGLAIGVGYAGNDALHASALSTGIAIQDVPEGLVVAVALLAAGYGRTFSVLSGMLSGLVEPIGAVFGAAVIDHSASLLPWGLGFAAGAMLFVIVHEIIPESHSKGNGAWATGGVMLGFGIMTLLDTTFG